MLSRRSLLKSAALAWPAAASLSAGRFLNAEETGTPGVSFPGLITRQRNPDNLEFPFATLSDWKTPTPQFFVRSHFNVPQLQADEWSLRVEGHVEQPFDINLRELQHFQSATQTTLLECAGNGRVYLSPLQAGLRWEQGGVSNADWTGTPLAALLERAKPKTGAIEVILEGHDKGRIGPPNPPSAGEIPFARSVSLAKASDPHTLLAWQMNGEDLTAAHGAPLRAIVPGWYGMASIKWLKRIIVTDRPFDGYFQTFNYTVWNRPEHGLATLTPVTEIDVKSQIARPVAYQTIPAGRPVTIVGAAWAGEPTIEKVEISTDGGKSWSPATLGEQSQPYAWRFFHFDWTNPARGEQTLMSRATDSRGRVQAMQRDEDRRDAMVTHVQPVPVSVR
ncbi:MAG: sulfite oxidase [Planctomycetaceae bacterium]|nr:sulfite oxidase [Planctomycetaceae bacterium]